MTDVSAVPSLRQERVAPLRSHHTRSGFRNVYCDGVHRYRCRVAKYVNIPGRFPTAMDAALHLVEWYEDFYTAIGHDWRAVLRSVRRNHGQVISVKGGESCRAYVWVMGSPVLVTEAAEDANIYHHMKNTFLPPCNPPKPSRSQWDSRDDARCAIREWLRKFRDSLGVKRRYASLYLWRA